MFKQKVFKSTTVAWRELNGLKSKQFADLLGKHSGVSNRTMFCMYIYKHVFFFIFLVWVCKLTFKASSLEIWEY